jgi:hypothetical protein
MSIEAHFNTGEDHGRRIPVPVMLGATVLMTVLFCFGLLLLATGAIERDAHPLVYGVSLTTVGFLWLRRERRKRLIVCANAVFAATAIIMAAYGVSVFFFNALDRDRKLTMASGLFGGCILLVGMWTYFNRFWKARRSEIAARVARAMNP